MFLDETVISKVLGLELGDAKKILTEYGYCGCIAVQTAPPRCKKGGVTDSFRVLRADIVSDEGCGTGSDAGPDTVSDAGPDAAPDAGSGVVMVLTVADFGHVCGSEGVKPEGVRVE